MPSASCLARIQQVRDVASDPDLAYAARTRLQRVILSCARDVAQRVGVAPPLFPGPLEISVDAPENLRRLCDTINRLIDRTRCICQPSEPLDERWSEGWSEILSHLDELERRVSAEQSMGG
jgi:hypothetical protein